jgi:hypothetical protein
VSDISLRTVPLALKTGPATGPGFWEEIKPSLEKIYPFARPGILFAHHNSYLVFILVSLLTGIWTRYFNREHADMLCQVFLWLPPLFIISHCAKPARTRVGFAELTSLMVIPYLTLLLLEQQTL